MIDEAIAQGIIERQFHDGWHLVHRPGFWTVIGIDTNLVCNIKIENIPDDREAAVRHIRAVYWAFQDGIHSGRMSQIQAGMAADEAGDAKPGWR